MMPSRIEYCVRSVSGEDRSTLLEADVKTEQQHCLKRCGLCHYEAFVVADGTVLTGGEYERTLVELESEQSATRGCTYE